MHLDYLQKMQPLSMGCIQQVGHTGIFLYLFKGRLFSTCLKLTILKKEIMLLLLFFHILMLSIELRRPQVMNKQ